MTQVGDRFLSTSAKSKTTTACTSQPIALAACAAQLAPKPDINTVKTPQMHIASLSISVYSLSMYLFLSSQKQLRYATDPSPQSSPLKLDHIAQSYHSPLDEPLYLFSPCPDRQSLAPSALDPCKALRSSFDSHLQHIEGDQHSALQLVTTSVKQGCNFRN